MYIKPLLKQLEKPTYDCVVISSGGVGTTFLINFLAEYLKTNSWNSFDDGIKHANSPLHPIFKTCNIQKAIYVFDDPRLAMVSLFRRDYAKHMIPKLNSLHASKEDYFLYVDNNLEIGIDLNSYLDEGKDLFGFESHFQNWLSIKHPPFPILGVRFSTLHKNIAEVLRFLELPTHLEHEFPPRLERASSLDVITDTHKQQINEIYGDLVRQIEEFPDLTLIER